MKYGFFRTLKRQFKIVNTQRKYYIYLLYFLELIAKGAIPVISLFMLQIVIDALSKNDFNYVLKPILIIIGLLLILGVISTLCEHLEQSIFLKIRMTEFPKLAQLYREMNYEFVEDEAFNEEYRLATTTFDGDNMGFQGTYSILFKIFPTLFTIILLTILLIKISIYILFAVLLSAGVGIAINLLMFKYQAKVYPRLKNANNQIYYFEKTLVDYHYGKDIRVYGMQDYLDNIYSNQLISYKTVLKDIANKRFQYSFLELLCLLILDAASFFLLAQAYYQQIITIGALTLYLGVVVALNTSIKTLGTLAISLVKNAKYTSDYYNFLEKYDFYGNWGTKKALVDEALTIELKNVSFKYPKTDKMVLENINLKISRGEKLAIVGENGAGKSTLIKLICGLFRPTAGQILINGININEFAREEYYKMIACVFQEVNLYSGTILENVCGDTQDLVAKEKAKAALSKLGLDAKINSLPKKYDQPILKSVEEDGVELSGGEAQRIAIARALYKDAPLVILDEPTAALDALAEAKIYESFAGLVKGRTAIYISHRLSSTKFCDHIALFSKEGLIEYGTHEELLALHGHYYEMFMVQGKYYREG